MDGLAHGVRKVVEREITEKSLELGMCMSRIEGIFWFNPPWWVKKNSTQPNLTHMDQVGSGWTNEFYNFIYLLLLSNWVEKKN